MPNYEYKCDDCKKIFDTFYLIDKKPKIVHCKNCNSGNTTKLFTIGGISFKGPGFYVNDYKKDI